MKATFPKGVVLGAAVAMVTLVGSAAVAGTGVGKVFNLGEDNRVNARSQLEGATPSAVLNVTNSDKSPAASGVSIDVPASDPPLVVNSATKVKNLNADLLDGHDASTFQSATSKACPNGTAITSITPDGATSCNGSVTLPIDVNLAPGASSSPPAFLPSSLGLKFDCEGGDVPTASMLVEDLGAAPATLNSDFAFNNVAPILGTNIIAPTPSSVVQFVGPPHGMAQLEYFDATTVTTINVSLLAVMVDNTFESCEYQGTMVIATR